MSRKKEVQQTVSPYPTAYSFSGKPVGLEREVPTRNQIRWDEDTLKYGDDDAFPLRIIDAVNQSPTTTSCIGAIQTFIRGAGFTAPELMTLKIDKDGTTLWALHCALADYLGLMDGFAVNFKFDGAGKIANAYLVNLETVRFKRPMMDDKSKQIDTVKVNPYFGTLEYQKKYSIEYPLWNQAALPDQVKAYGTKFPGQIYYYGSLRPPFKFYPVPKYWSGHEWIYVDGQIQQFHKNNLDNGFFQSVLMTQVGNPNQKSNNPKYKVTETGSDGVTKVERFTKTVGEEFDEQMSSMFSGVKKAGTVFNLWANSVEQRPTIAPFPVNSQFDVLAGTFTDAIRGITIATEVPAILANLPQQNSSLGSDGNAMSMAIQLMQSRTLWKRKILENFYNTILLPNLQSAPSQRVEIQEYSPISSVIDFRTEKAFELYWEFMDPQEKVDFINSNVSEIKVKPRPAAATPAPAQEAPVVPMTVNENLKNLTGRQMQNISRIIRQYNKGQIDYTFAKISLRDGYAYSDEQIDDILGINDEKSNPVVVSK